MPTREVRVEDLLGRTVVDAGGRAVGRIEEMRAAERGGEYVVEEFLIGVYALLDRLAAWDAIRGLLGGTRLTRPRPYRVRWDEIDLGDPRRPRLRVPAERVTVAERHAA